MYIDYIYLMIISIYNKVIGGKITYFIEIVWFWILKKGVLSISGAYNSDRAISAANISIANL
jgi:hypothetical protein